MKYIRQFCIIIVISFIGELLGYLIPLPIPGSIYGLILMFIGLMTGVVPYESVKDTGKFLVDVMPVMFVPATVGIMNVWDIVRGSLWKYVLVLVVTTVVVMSVAGLISQLVIKRKRGAENE